MSLDSQIPPQEQHELDLLAAELRDAMPVAELSSDFQERLEARLRNSWTLRSAFERNGLIRVAAALLVMTMVAAPVAAWVGLWPQQKKSPPAIGFELPEEIDVDEDGGVLGDFGGSQVVGPIDEFDGPTWTAERSLAIEQSYHRNRLQYAAATLKASGQGGNYPEFSLPFDSDWEAADWASLWQEFGRRCLNSDFSNLPDALLQRCTERLSSPIGDAPDATEIAARAAWTWVLRGATAAAGSVELAWPGAPFVASR